MKQESNLKRTSFWAVAMLFTVGVVAVQQGFAQDQNLATCSRSTLNGRYIFDATGWNIVDGKPVPKTVVEFLTFNGEGGLTSIATAVVGGKIIAQNSHGSGTYMVNDDCTGSLIFNGSGFTFDLYISPDGSQFHMTQTTPGQMLAGAVQRLDQ